MKNTVVSAPLPLRAPDHWVKAQLHNIVVATQAEIKSIESNIDIDRGLVLGRVCRLDDRT